MPSKHAKSIKPYSKNSVWLPSADEKTASGLPKAPQLDCDSNDTKIQKTKSHFVPSFW